MKRSFSQAIGNIMQLNLEISAAERIDASALNRFLDSLHEGLWISRANLTTQDNATPGYPGSRPAPSDNSVAKEILKVIEAERLPRAEDALQLLRLDTQRCADVMFKMLHDPKAAIFVPYEKEVDRHRILRLLVRLSRTASVFPSGLLIKGVECKDKEPVACGGFSDIFHGKYQGGRVALKRLRVFQHNSDEEEKSYRALCREALVWKYLRHKHVLPFLGVDRTVFTRFYCLVSPWMDRGNIRDCRNRLATDRYPIPATRWLLEIASGLSYLHSQFVIHGDLRGPNIFITQDGTIQIADFGLSIFSDSTSASLCSKGNGAVRWLAPELLNGSRHTYESDVYAYGGVWLEVATGKSPFSNVERDAQVIARVTSGISPDWPDDCAPGLEIDDWKFVQQCWDKDPAKRPSAKSLLGSCCSIMSKKP